MIRIYLIILAVAFGYYRGYRAGALDAQAVKAPVVVKVKTYDADAGLIGGDWKYGKRHRKILKDIKELRALKKKGCP